MDKPMTASPSKASVRATTAPTPPTRKLAPTVKEIKARLPDIPLDFSFMNLNSILDIVKEDPISGRKRLTTDDAGKVVHKKTAAKIVGGEAYTPPVSIRLNDNGLTSIDDLDAALSGVFEDPTRLQWIDLSGNAIAQLPKTVFARYTQLSTLHLHANKLCAYADIDALFCLVHLRQLTLHGNPVDEKKHYRVYTIYHMPSLVQLDYSTITQCERERSETWAVTYRKQLAIRRGEQVDDM
ncbi:hypothetical protein SPRG_11450 [Saprolegnia parasitica CBS 223.65]|uniref:Leucine-rich repeat-containing protein 51 n=1 Tax=Saprolegnia parasitica (strain CBS 223.65) TaxID=695850 RepID=A0A067BYL1_SAPPC|nr:hypothetical protein SPRG_11450 [Saprolegnia parasitica CBS 223.65]KDO23358.1 hypothetical protein SPRG_11450 [Saprolegnia parasitica CBS 223.65]|eukprot:XP_012205849.1 hypothetical protein SPRG_11450 [Saprolegnia parasitica CBS 223.65]